MKFLTNTFSPLMSPKCKFEGQPVSFEIAKKAAKESHSVVSHEITANIMTALLKMPVPYNRVNIEIVPGDEIVCIVPNFRARVSREFTHKEIVDAGFLCFIIKAKHP